MRITLPLLSLLCLTPALTAQVSSRGPHTGIKPAQWKFDYYQILARDWNPRLKVEIFQQAGPHADLYLRRNQPPTLTEWDARSVTSGTSNELVILDQTTTPVLTTDTWHIGVWRPHGTSYSISYRLETEASTRPGPGAVPWDDRPNGGRGTSFRVWAPNATSVYLTGSFNSWNTTNAPMASEGNEWWSLDVRNLLPGAEYQYVIDAPGSRVWRNDPRALQVTSSLGKSVVVDQEAFDWSGDNFQLPAWNDLVIYETHIGTFYDAVGGDPGTLLTAATKLDYLKDLGVTAIELMPFCEFPGEYSWGYNYSHPFSVESHYGTPEQFKSFVKAAHARDMAVFADVLFNHWGPTEMDLWQFDGWSPGSQYGGIYFYNDSRSQTPWGDTRPNFNSSEVRNYIRDNVLMWLDDYHFDGLRWDATSYIRSVNGTDLPEAWSLMQWVNDEVDALLPNKISIAEDMWSNAWITKDTGAGGAGFDSQWDPNFVHTIRGNLIVGGDVSRNMWSVRDAINYNYNGDHFQRVIYTESHDEVANGRSRLPEEIWPGNADSWFSKKRSTLGAVLVMTSPGIPMLFQGQEFLEDGHFDDHDPLDWSKLSTFSGIHKLYKALIALRRNLPGYASGLKGSGLNIHHVNDSDKFLAFHRWDQGGQGDDVIVVLNFANKWYTSYSIGLPSGGTWQVRFNSDSTTYDSSFGNYGSTSVTANNTPQDGMPFSGNVRIAPYSALILSR